MFRKFRRSIRRPRKTNYRRRGTYKLAKRAAKSVLWKNSETKYYDLSVGHSFGTTGSIYELTSNIVQGTGRANRIGNKIKITGMRAQLTYTKKDETNHLRVIFARAKDVTNATSTIYWPNVNGPLDTERFTPWKDNCWMINNDVVSVVKKWRMKNSTTITYTNVNGSGTMPITMYHVSDSTTLEHPYVAGYIRIYFKDI